MPSLVPCTAALLSLVVASCLLPPPLPCLKGPPQATAAAAPASEPSPTSTSDTKSADSSFYPAGPRTAPPPVSLPEGKGASIKLQQYIVVDQFGYRPDMAKVAVLADPQIGWNADDAFEPGPTLEVRRWLDGEVVFQGPSTPWKNGDTDEASGDRGAWFDFSTVEAPGLYYVYDAKSQTRSYPFEIGKDVYRPVLQAAVRMFYFNRANFAKKPPFSCVGKKCWSLGVDYMGEGQDREARSVTDRNNAKTARDLSGGWWDAGDTDKYVTFTQDVLHQLLTAFEEHPKAFTDDFNLPESGNGLPDLIDEVRVELDWLKKMQPDDLNGGALIKMGNVDYGDPVPDMSRLARYYYPQACSSATIVLAGVFAHAALVLGQFPTQKAYAADLAARAGRAFDFYVANPKNAKCDDGTIKSGAADRSVADQAQIAVVSAVYLFALTHDAKYDALVRKDYALTRPFTDDRWSLYDQSQGDALLYYASLPKVDPATKQAILERKQAQGEHDDIYKFRPELDFYRAYMRPDAYHWGSNNVRAAFGNTNWDMIQHGLASAADRASFSERAAGILHSFHGVNPIQLVYLSNMYAYGGDNCVDEMFHSWFRDKDPKWDNARTSEFGPAPGYVTGGPNRSYCDGNDSPPHRCRNSRLRKMPSGKAYLDFNTAWEPNAPYDQSWALTEPAIYYQASYVRLVSKFVE